MSTPSNPAIPGISNQFAPGRRSLDDEEAAARQRVARQSLSLGSFFKPFAAIGGGLLSRLWAAMVALVRRVASVFHVDVKVPDHVDARQHAPVAEFTSSDPSNGPEKVEAAAKEAARDLSEMVARLSNQRVDRDRLRGEQGPAYAVLNLQALGSALVEARSDLEASDKALAEAADEASAKCGLSADQLKSFLVACDFSDPASLDFFSADVRARAENHAKLKSMLCQLQLQFCDMAITALRVAKEEKSSDLEKLTSSKVFQFADQEMAELILDKSATTFEEDGDILVAQSTLPDIESEKTILAASAAVATSSGRSRWAGCSAGIVDDVPEESEPAVASRPRDV